MVQIKNNTSTKKEKNLGILGGMGPMASQLLYKKITEQTLALCDQDHLNIFLYSHATLPDRSQAIAQGKEEEIISLLQKDCLTLQNLGAHLIAIPCNTSHYFFPKITPQLDIPILSMVDATAQAVAKKSPKKVAVLATEGTTSTGLYQKALHKNDLDPFPLPCHLQDIVNHLIYQEIKQGKKGSLPPFQALETYLLEQEVDTIILACTELSVFATEQQLNPALYVDALDILATESIKLCGKPLRPTTAN